MLMLDVIFGDGSAGVKGFRLAGTVEKDSEVRGAVETAAVRAGCESCGGRTVSKPAGVQGGGICLRAGVPVVLVRRRCLTQGAG